MWAPEYIQFYNMPYLVYDVRNSPHYLGVIVLRVSCSFHNGTIYRIILKWTSGANFAPLTEQLWTHGPTEFNPYRAKTAWSNLHFLLSTALWFPFLLIVTCFLFHLHLNYFILALLYFLLLLVFSCFPLCHTILSSLSSHPATLLLISPCLLSALLRHVLPSPIPSPRTLFISSSSIYSSLSSST